MSFLYCLTPEGYATCSWTTSAASLVCMKVTTSSQARPRGRRVQKTTLYADFRLSHTTRSTSRSLTPSRDSLALLRPRSTDHICFVADLAGLDPLECPEHDFDDSNGHGSRGYNCWSPSLYFRPPWRLKSVHIYCTEYCKRPRFSIKFTTNALRISLWFLFGISCVLPFKVP